MEFVTLFTVIFSLEKFIYIRASVQRDDPSDLLSSTCLCRSRFFCVFLFAQLLDCTYWAKHDFCFNLRRLSCASGTVCGHCTRCSVPVVVVVIDGTRDVSTGIADQVVIHIAIAITIFTLIWHVFCCLRCKFPNYLVMRLGMVCFAFRKKSPACQKSKKKKSYLA